MISYKQDFPILANNPDLVFLDNAASTQKPRMVIEETKRFMENDYANIHRWAYSLSEKSEEIYFQSKDIVAKSIGGRQSEVIYTYNSTYAFNILVQSLVRTWLLKRWDKVLLTVAEHHSNIVPWIIMKEDFGIDVDFIDTNDKHDLDFDHFDKIYDKNVKLVSATWVSNVTGSIFDMKKLSQKLRDDTMFVVDASQAIPNFQVDVKAINCDFLIFTWHKMMWPTGIWVLWWKKELLKELKPSIWGGGSIEDVTKSEIKFAQMYQKFEIGTPNIIGAAWLLKAFEYIQKIGWWQSMQDKETALTWYALESFLKHKDKVQIIWKETPENRIWVFSFVLKNTKIPPFRLWELMALKNICIRCGWHCAHPYIKHLCYDWTCRMSLYIYNDKKDIDRFFEELMELI